MALLSRTAENLYWIGRYVERAENMARLLESGKRMSAIPRVADQPPPWEAILSAAGVLSNFQDEYAAVNQSNAVDHLAFSQSNPSSIHSSVAAARANARSVRTAMTIDMWEALNSFWHEILRTPVIETGRGQLLPFLERVKQYCALFRGVAESTMLQNDAYNFLRLGTFVERTDCTARLLDVEYYALTHPEEAEDSPVDTYHWAVILRATSSVRAYNWVYGGGYDLENMIDFLVFNNRSPRSLAHCIERTTEHLDRLALLYAERHDSHEICASMATDLSRNAAEEVIEGGLHEFLTRFIARNNWLSNQIARDYHFSNVVQSQEMTSDEEVKAEEDQPLSQAVS